MATLQTSLKIKQEQNIIPKYTIDEGIDDDSSMENSISEEDSQAVSGQDD